MKRVTHFLAYIRTNVIIPILVDNPMQMDDVDHSDSSLELIEYKS